MKLLFNVPEETRERLLTLRKKSGAMTASEVARRALAEGLQVLERQLEVVPV